MGIREKQKAQRRRDILMKALELFSMQGFAETKITDIADGVKMSTGLLFHYFESKEILYGELLKTGLDYVNKRTSNLVKEPIEYFECAINMVFDLFKTNYQSAQLFLLIRRAFKSNNTPYALRDYMEETFDKIFKINEKRILLGQQNGVIRQANPEVLNRFLFDCLDGIAESYIVNPSLPLPETSWILDIIKKHN